MSGPAGEFGQYLRAIKDRLWLVALITAIAVGAAYWMVGRVPERYTATTLLVVTAPVLAAQPGVSGEGGGGGFGQTMGVVTADIVELISSRTISERVARRLNLPPGAMRGAVSATAQRGTDLLRISGSARNPQRAAALANTTAEEFTAFFREINRASIAETRRFVEQQMAQARGRLEAIERSLQAFRENRGIVSITEASSRAASQMASVQLELDSSLRLRREQEARMAAARERLNREQPTRLAARTTIENPIFRQLQGHLTGLEITRTQLAQVYTAQHPRMDQLNREINDVRARLTNEARTALNEERTENNPLHARLVSDILGLEVERAALNARIDALLHAQRQRQAAILDIPRTETEFNRLTREHGILETNYTALSTRYQEILLRENEAGFAPAALHIIEPALAPTRAAQSSFPRTAAAAGLAGLVLGIMAALLLEALDDRIRSAQDAERTLGVPVLAQIPAQGQPRTAPGVAAFVLILLLAVGVAWAAVARGRLPHVQTFDRVRLATTVVASWIGGAQPQVAAIGLAGDDR